MTNEKNDYIIPIPKQARRRIDKGEVYREMFHLPDGTILEVLLKNGEIDKSNHREMTEVTSKMIGINLNDLNEEEMDWSKIMPDPEEDTDKTAHWMMESDDGYKLLLTSYEEAKRTGLLDDEYIERMEFNYRVIDFVDEIMKQVEDIREDHNETMGDHDASNMAIITMLVEEMFERATQNDFQKKEAINNFQQRYAHKYAQIHPNEPVDLGGMMYRDLETLEELQNINSDESEGEPELEGAEGLETENYIVNERNEEEGDVEFTQLRKEDGEVWVDVPDELSDEEEIERVSEAVEILEDAESFEEAQEKVAERFSAEEVTEENE